MTTVSSYVHALNGRLRIKIAAMKGSPMKAREIERQLGTARGIIQARANPITGNLLILYDSSKLTQQAILDILRSSGWIPASHDAEIPTGLASALGHALAETLVRSTMELAVQGLVRALI